MTYVGATIVRRSWEGGRIRAWRIGPAKAMLDALVASGVAALSPS